MNRNRFFKVIGNLFLLLALCTGQVSAAPNNGAATGGANAPLQPAPLQDNPAPGQTVRISTDGGTRPTISADGMFVAFEHAGGIYVHDLMAGMNTLIDTGSRPDISATGRYIAYVQGSDVYVWDRDAEPGQEKTFVGSGFPYSSANFNRDTPSVSADGRYVEFETTTFVRLWDRENPGSIRTLRFGTDPNECHTVDGMISADGRYVLFHRYGSGFTMSCVGTYSGGHYRHDIAANTSPLVPIGGVAYDATISMDGRYVTYVQNVGDPDLPIDQISIRDIETGNVTAVPQSWFTDYAGYLSADGRYLAFSTNASAYVYDTTTQVRTLVSVTPAGAHGGGVTGDVRISANGQYVVFSSTSSTLVTGDTNGVRDVFVRGTYFCNPDELGPIANAVLTSLEADEQTSRYCKNTYHELITIPDPALLDPDASVLQAYQKFAELIVNAKYEVDFSTMIWKDEPGNYEPADVILNAIDDLYENVIANPGDYPQGVTVRILLGYEYENPWVNQNQAEHVLDGLAARGVYRDNTNWKVEVASYGNSYPMPSWPIGIHSHVKMLVVDGRELIVTGYNVDSGYANNGVTTDMGIRFSGPIAQDALNTFDKIWAGARICADDDCFAFDLAPSEDDIVHLPSVTVVPPADWEGSNVFSLYRDNDERYADFAVRDAMSAATQNLRILQNRFFQDHPATLDLSDEFLESNVNGIMPYTHGILQALENGADVTMIVSGNNAPYDRPLSATSVFLLLKHMEEQNISLQSGQSLCVKMVLPYLHAKTLSIDDEFLIVGSANFDFSSYGNVSAMDLAEYSLGTDDPNAVSAFNARFEAELNRSKQLYILNPGSSIAGLSCNGVHTASPETLQAAIDQAEPGSYILATPGTYTETITVNEPVNIMALRPDLTVIDPPANQPAFRVTTDGVTIDRMTIRGADGYGIEIENNSAGDFEDIQVTNILFDNNDGGVLLSGTNGIQYELENNTFVGGESAVTIDTGGTSSPSVVRNNLMIGQTVAPVLITAANDGGVDYGNNLFTQCPENDCEANWVSGDLSPASDVHDNLFDIDPEFENASNGDFRLQPDSPILEAGDTSGMTGEYVPQSTYIGALADWPAPEDNTAPSVESSVRASANPTSASSVDFTVTFSEAVTGVNATDFTLTTTGVTGASVNSVSGSGDAYTVSVNTGSGNGTIRLNVLDDDSIVDGASNPLDGGYTEGETYTVNKDGPWNTFFGADVSSNNHNMMVRDEAGNFYISGVSTASWGNPIRPYSGGDDLFVAKLDPYGNLVWNTFLGSPGDDMDGFGIAIDSLEGVYVIGSSNATWGSPVRAFTEGPQAGWPDMFVARLYGSGELHWNTFLGGEGWERPGSIAYDNDTLYVIGSSDATWGSPINPYNAGTDGFVVKLSSWLGTVSWNTFFGESGEEIAYSLNADSNGNSYVTGFSTATWGSPARPFTGTGNDEAYVAKFDGSGALLWNTFLGGNGADVAYETDLDASGNLYVSGRSTTTWGDPVLTYGGGTQDGFVAKVDSSTGGLSWQSFLGGTGADYAWGIEADANNEIQVVGGSTATWGTPVNPYQADYDAFYAKLNSSGGLLGNTFIGGSGFDKAYDLSVEADQLYVSGHSNATWGEPIVPFGGSYDAYLAKIEVGSLPLIVSSVVRTSANPTSASTVDYTVTFSESVSGVDESDFTLTVSDLTNTSLSNVTGSGAVYTVTVNTGTGNGTLRLDVLDDDSIVNGASNPLGAGFTNGPVYTVNTTVPGPWNTFLGGSGLELGYGSARDAQGNLYFTGQSNATWGNPIRPYSGDNDTFVAKVSPAGVLIWNTFLGGADWDAGQHINIDGDGNLYISGHSEDTWGDPVTAYGGGDIDSFIVKLDPSGALVWNTFLGGSGEDRAWDAVADANGNVYVNGNSNATWGSPLAAYTDQNDEYVAKLDPSGVLVWNTFLGGSGNDFGYNIVLDAGNNIFVSGYADDTWGSPLRPYSGGLDATVAKLDSSGGLVWNTFLGGSEGNEVAYDLTLYLGEYLYVTGNSGASWGDPISAFGGGGQDGMLVMLYPDGQMNWNTFFGGSGTDYGFDVKVGIEENVYLTGASNDGWGYPILTHAGDYDAAALKFNAAGDLLANSFLGGSGLDKAYGVELDNDMNLYVAGYSDATWGSPVRPYTHDRDAFMVRTHLLHDAPLIVASVRRNGPAITTANEVTFTVVFSGDVSGVDATDFQLTASGVSGASIIDVSGLNNTYIVTVDTGTGSGSLHLDVLDDDSIQDPLLNNLAGGYTLGQSIQIDRTGPTVTSIVRASTNPTSASTVDYTVTFSEPVLEVDGSDFSLTTTGSINGAGVIAMSGSGDTYTLTVETGTGSGTIRLDVVDDDTIQDALNNKLGGTGTDNGNFNSGEVYNIDHTAPMVSSSVRAATSPAAASTVTFTVTFSEAVSGVNADDFSLTTTGSVTGASVGAVNGSGSSYTVTVNTGTGSGTIRLNVVDNDTILDAVSNPLDGDYTSGQSYAITGLTVNSVAASDGWVLEASENSGNGGTFNRNAATFVVGDDAANKQYRAFLHFDTSSLPDNAVITSVQIRIREGAVTGTSPFTTHGSLVADIQKPYYGANNILVAPDFQATAGQTSAATFDVPVGSWSSATLTLSGYPHVSLTGTTQFRLSFMLDDNNDSSVDTISFSSGEAAAANRPQLIIEYYIP